MPAEPFFRTLTARRTQRALILWASLAVVTVLLLSQTSVSMRSGGLWFAVFFSATLSSIVGFAFSPIAGAILFHTGAGYMQTVQIMLFASISMQIYSVYYIRHSISVRKLVPFLLGGLATLAPGIYIATRTDPQLLLLIIGAFLVLYGLYTLTRPALCVPGSEGRSAVLAGALGGITGPVAAFPAAFVAILCAMKGGDKCQQRGVVQPYILIMQILSLGGLFAAGGPHATIDWSSLQYCVPAVVGSYLGLKVFAQLRDSQFALLVGVFLTVSGLSMITRCF
jgi:uncharacterized membrane protein YfcA